MIPKEFCILSINIQYGKYNEYLHAAHPETHDFIRPLLSIVAVGSLFMVTLLIFFTNLSPPSSVLLGLLMGLGGGILWVVWEVSRVIRKMQNYLTGSSSSSSCRRGFHLPGFRLTLGEAFQTSKVTRILEQKTPCLEMYFQYQTGKSLQLV